MGFCRRGPGHVTFASTAIGAAGELSGLRSAAVRRRLKILLRRGHVGAADCQPGERRTGGHPAERDDRRPRARHRALGQWWVDVVTPLLGIPLQPGVLLDAVPDCRLPGGRQRSARSGRRVLRRQGRPRQPTRGWQRSPQHRRRADRAGAASGGQPRFRRGASHLEPGGRPTQWTDHGIPSLCQRLAVAGSALRRLPGITTKVNGPTATDTLVSPSDQWRAVLVFDSGRQRRGTRPVEQRRHRDADRAPRHPGGDGDRGRRPGGALVDDPGGQRFAHPRLRRSSIEPRGLPPGLPRSSPPPARRRSSAA